MCLSMLKTVRLILIQSKEIRCSKLHMQSSHLWNKHQNIDIFKPPQEKRNSSNFMVVVWKVERAQLFPSRIYIKKISVVNSRGSIIIIFGALYVLMTLSTDIPVCVCVCAPIWLDSGLLWSLNSALSTLFTYIKLPWNWGKFN